MANKHYRLLIIVSSILIYSLSVFNFFSADDWFHLRVSNISSLAEFMNFFSFSKTSQSISFYRPLSTQLFFSIFQKLFGFNQVPYHIFVLGAFCFLLILLYKLAYKLTKSKSNALIAMTIYGFSVSNFTRLYFLSAFQEVALVIFSLLSIINYLDNRRARSLVFLVLALLCKETAIVLPIVLLVIDWSRKKVDIRKILPFVAIVIPYLYLRIFVFGGTAGESYVWDFSPFRAVNTLMWYILWSIGAPELLVDYIGSGLRPIPRFFTDYPIWSYFILFLLIINIIILGFLLVKKIKRFNRKFFSLVILFVISLTPVLFLPLHKFTLELGLPLIWFSLAVTWLIQDKKITIITFIVFYLILNLSMNYLTYTRHYSVGSAVISQKVFSYFQKYYPEEPTGSYFEFINDTNNYGQNWGSSKQISNSVGGSELFRVLYQDPKYTVYFQDFPGERPRGESKIMISTKMFYQ